MARVNGYREFPDDDDDDHLRVGRGRPRRSRTPQPRREYGDGYGTGYGLAPPPEDSWGNNNSQQNGRHPRRHSFNGGPPPSIKVEGPSRERSPSPYATEYTDSRYRHVPPRRYSAPKERPTPTSRATSPSPSNQLNQVGENSAVLPQPSATAGTKVPGVIPSSQAPGDGTFKHRVLQQNEFRLLKILPEASSIIKCEVFHAPLDNPPSYTAISYAWGDADNTEKIQIQIDGDKVPITASLHGALKALRQKTEVLVWADGVCINQHDNDERSKQVQLMVMIYASAQSVAIWLGPEGDDSKLALELLERIAYERNSLEALKAVVSHPKRRAACAALVSLFERDYWERLWVVQEVYNAQEAWVHCGEVVKPWRLFKVVCEVFKRYEKELKPFFVTDWVDDDQRSISRYPLRYSHVLTQGGPSSFPDVRYLRKLGDRTLLEVLRACRPKLATDPRDKVYAILGLLPQEMRGQFIIPNYSSSPTEVYINVVDFLLTTTHRLDIICEAIHYPVHVSSIRLPTWVPNWSQIPHRELLSRSYTFSADRNTRVEFRYLDDKGNKIENAGSIIEIEAIELDVIQRRGMAVDVLNELDSYLMCFYHWRALLLSNHDDDGSDANYTNQVRDAFCRTLSLGHLPPRYSRRPYQWATTCYHVFASLIRERLPFIPLDKELRRYADERLGLDLDDWKDILNEACHDSMKGRSFCVTEDGLMGLGSGFMAAGDLVVVPLGCHTPIVLRREGNHGKYYRFVGDIYIDGYMQGKAVDELDNNERKLKKYVLR